MVYLALVWAGVEWEMDIDWSGTNVVVASEAHAITLAVEGLLGVIFTVSLLTDEAFEDAFAVRAPFSCSGLELLHSEDACGVP